MINYQNSLFTNYPEFQRKYFPSMPLSEGMTITKLRIHGARVVRSVGLMVDHVKSGNDEELIRTIKEVCTAYSIKLVYFI